MKYLFYFLLILALPAKAQETIKTAFVKAKPLKADTFVSQTTFGSTFYIKNNVFIKASKNDSPEPLEYNNFQLGDLTSVHTFNTLKINLFYKQFNTAIILDNRLAEIFKIDFNRIQPYKNVSNISTGYDNTLWIFNQDTQQLELYDYKTNVTRAPSLPVKSTVLDLKSNYNYCWLLTKDYLYVYNYFGVLLKKTKNNGYTALTEDNGNIILKKGNSLFYIKKNTTHPIPVELPNLLIKQFFVTNESLYIYDDELLHEYQIKTN